jgi:hypothetical protein
MKNKKIIIWSLIVAVLVLGTVGAYFLTKSFLNERQSMMTNASLKRHIRVPQQTSTTKRIYTPQELEEARKKGTLPPSAKQPYMPPNTAGDAAIQQSLRTIEEINKINAMNQKLMDQQRRIQNQNQNR